MFKRGRVFSTTPAEFCVEKYRLLLLLGLHPKPALLFSLQKSKQKASPLGTYKTYFEPGVLQLPTVRQIKRLYNSVQNRFYKQVQKGAFNGNNTAKDKSKRQQQKQGGKRRFVLCRGALVQEFVFAGCFFKFATYGRALVWAQCG